MKYRKRPVVIEAIQITAADWNGSTWEGSPFKGDIPVWLVEALQAGTLMPQARRGTDYAEWDIVTLEGTMTATPGDWIIRGVRGELYPVKPDIFAATYETVADATGEGPE